MSREEQNWFIEKAPLKGRSRDQEEKKLLTGRDHDNLAEQIVSRVLENCLFEVDLRICREREGSGKVGSMKKMEMVVDSGSLRVQVAGPLKLMMEDK